MENDHFRRYLPLSSNLMRSAGELDSVDYSMDHNQRGDAAPEKTGRGDKRRTKTATRAKPAVTSERRDDVPP